METFIGYWQWWLLAIIVIIVPVIWFFPDFLRSPFYDPSEDRTQTSPLCWSPIFYTAENVEMGYLYSIVVNGKLRQKFYVQEIRGAAFLIGVFQHGDTGEGQGRAHFTGWTTRLLNNRPIRQRDLEPTPPA